MRRIYTLFLGILLVAVVGFSVGLIQPASAAPDSGAGDTDGSPQYLSMSVMDQVRFLDRYRAFRSCLAGNYIMKSTGDNPFVFGNTLANPTEWGELANVTPGYSNDPDSNAECENLTAPVIADLGYGSGASANAKFLLAMGFTISPTPSPDGANNYVYNGSKAQLINQYDRLAGGALGIAPETLWNYGSVIYERAMYAAKNKCKITVDKPLSEQTAADRAISQNPKTIYYTNPTTKKVEKYIIIFDVTIEDWAKKFALFEKLERDPYKVNCNDLINILNNEQYAKAHQSYVAAHTTANAGGLGSSAGGTAGGTTSTPDDCPLPDDTSMRWFGCSIMSVAKIATDALYGAIQQFLYTPTSAIFDNEPLKQAAAGIRNVALALVVVAGLVMVIAQASGSELVDAYTIRKLLPRMGVAILGISLAWPLLRLAVDITNTIGSLADGILMGVTAAGTGGSSNDIGTNIISSIFAVGAAGGAWIFLGAAGLVSMAGTLVLAMLVGLFVLAIRQLVIMVCVVLAPLAIAAYVLPGTQKLWGFWKNTFLTSLLMFPIIMFFLASGAAFSAILGGANTSTATLLAVIVFIAPYFLLPFAFKLAGGLMATIFSIASDKNRGMFDRLKKGRSNSINEKMGAMKQGNRFQGNTGVARAFNRTTRGAAVVASGSAGYNPLKMGQRGRSAMSSNTLVEAKEALEKNQHLKAISANDDFLQAALLHRGNEASQRKYLRDKGYDDRSQQDAVAAIRLAQRSMSNDGFDTAAAMALPATGTAFKRRFNQATGQWEGGAGEMHEFINNVAGKDRNRAATMLAGMRSGATQARRFDLAGGGYGSQLGVMNDQFNHTISSNDATRRITKESLEGQGGGYIAGARKNAVEAFAPEILDNLQTASMGNGVMSAAQIEQNMNKELAIMAGRYDAMASVAPENARVLDAGVMSQQLTINGVTKTVQQHIEDRRGNPAFQELRREYQSSAATAAQQVQIAGQRMPPGMQNLGGQPQGPQAPPF